MKENKDLKRFLKRVEKLKKRNAKKKTQIQSISSGVNRLKQLNVGEFNSEDGTIKLTYKND